MQRIAATSSMWTSTAATVSPVRRSTSYATRERTVAATSARLSPYSTTTCRSSRSPSPEPETAIPCVSLSRVSRRFSPLPAMPTTP